MKIIFDGAEMEAHENETMGEFIKRAGVRLREGCIFAVKRPLDIEKIPTNLYEIVTTRGKMILRWECEQEIEKWKQAYRSFEGCGVRWATNNSVVFGPTKTEFTPSKEEVELRRHEVTISLSGSSNENSHLVFSKRTHSGLYFPPIGCTVMGRVVYGRHLLEVFKIGDRIVKIAPVLERRVDPKSLLRVDKGYRLNVGDEIFTRIEVVLDPLSPISGEHVYNALKEGFVVTRRTSRFIAHDKISLISINSEKMGVRERGDISVRCSGLNVGSVYIYLQSAALSKDHTIAGHVIRGIELADVAGEEDVINVILKPERLDLLGKRQGEVATLLKERGIRHVRDGYGGDDGIVVDQVPSTTLEVYEKGEVKCTDLPSDQILRIKLDAGGAPASVKYFRRVTGLDLRRVGSLSVFFSTKDLVLFKGDEGLGKGLMPENTPKGIVEKGVIGVTNSVKRHIGMIGIRLSESDKFGPTAESYEGTNIIGRVLENIEVLKGLKEGIKVYIMEED